MSENIGLGEGGTIYSNGGFRIQEMDCIGAVFFTTRGEELLERFYQ